jgi:hypothetical protein
VREQKLRHLINRFGVHQWLIPLAVDDDLGIELTRYLAPQGSVCVDGVSLTVVAVDRDRFRVALIPHTVASTTLGKKGQGGAVNVEVDVLSKYVERHMASRTARPSIAALFEDLPKEEPKPKPKPTPVPRAQVPPKRARAKPARRSPAPRKVAKKSAKPSRSAARRSPARRPAARAKPAKRRR